MSQKTPLVFDDASQQHRPLRVGETLTNNAVPVSAQAGNLLSVAADGLFVADPGQPVGPPVSPAEGNYLRLAADGGLYVGGNDVLSNGDDNLLRIDATDKKIKLTKADVVDAASTIKIVSGDTGNMLTVGSDKGAFLASSTVAAAVPVSTDPNNILTKDPMGALLVSSTTLASDLVSPTTPNALVIDSTGKLYVDPVPVITPDDLRSADADNQLVLGSDDKLYVHKVTPAGFVSQTDKILVVSNDGKVLSTAFQAVYDQITGNLTFLGKNGEQIAQVVIQSQGSVLESVSVVTDPPGMPPGTYLAMTFRKNDGSTETVYADLSAVGDVYTAGNGIDITNRVISAKVAANGGLELTSDGLQLNAATATTGLISSDSGNMIVKGSDNKLYAPLDCGELD